MNTEINNTLPLFITITAYIMMMIAVVRWIYTYRKYKEWEVNNLNKEIQFNKQLASVYEKYTEQLPTEERLKMLNELKAITIDEIANHIKTKK